jgi:hypothetical protein
MSSCAFTPCCDADECALIGGCVATRFPGQQPADHAMRRSAANEAGLREDAPALNGTRPREVRDPLFMPRKRKAIAR